MCYADDIALLAPSPSALRIMLSTCEDFAESHGLKFNPEKTQLVKFGLSSLSSCKVHIAFGGVVLDFTDTVSHLGHLLSYNLDDTPDIIRATKDLNRRANFVLCVFPFTEISVNYLSFCLSMYRCSLWSLSCKNVRIIECALNKIIIFRRVWNLTSLSHTRIVHCVSNIQSVSNCIFKCFNSMLSGVKSSLSPLIRCVFSDSSQCGHSFVGYNFQYSYQHLKMY